MNDLITAAQSNDIGRLRQLLENRNIAQDPSYFPSGSLHKACEAAARNNHPEALEVLLDEGIKIERGKSFEQLSDHHEKLIVCEKQGSYLLLLAVAQ